VGKRPYEALRLGKCVMRLFNDPVPDLGSRYSVHFSSADSNWETPQQVFDRLDAEFGFDLDACATPETAKCKLYYSEADDALLREWRGVVWCNPPYGREIGRWMCKAYLSALEGATVVCLVPSRTDTRWWHEYEMKGEVRFLRGRLKFGGAQNSAPFPSAVVVFRPIGRRIQHLYDNE
jgi:phage N-6-adenine-methyltransferase